MLLQVQSLSDASNKLKHTILKEKKVDIEIPEEKVKYG